MMCSGPAVQARAVLTVALAAGIGGITCWALSVAVAGSWAGLQRPAPVPDDVVGLIAGSAGLALSAWWTLGAALTAFAAVAEEGIDGAGRVARAARALTPQVLRRAVAVSVGVCLVAGGTAAQAAVPRAGRAAPLAAHASGTTSEPTSDTIGGRVRAQVSAQVSDSIGDRLDLGWGSAARPVATPVQTPVQTPVPTLARRPVQPVARPVVQPPVRRPVPPPDVVVRPGDTLWALAERQLTRALPSPGRSAGHAHALPATDAQVAQAWPGWFAANRAVIGADPDHIEPGQHLVPPA